VPSIDLDISFVAAAIHFRIRRFQQRVFTKRCHVHRSQERGIVLGSGLQLDSPELAHGVGLILFTCIGAHLLNRAPEFTLPIRANEVIE
jgi:hypothetical protein